MLIIADEKQVDEGGKAGDGGREPGHGSREEEGGRRGSSEEEDERDSKHDQRANRGSKCPEGEKPPFAQVGHTQYKGQREEPSRQAGCQDEEAEDEGFEANRPQGKVRVLPERGDE